MAERLAGNEQASPRSSRRKQFSEDSLLSHEIDVAMKKWFEEVGRTCVTEDLQKLSEFMEMCFNVEIHNKMQEVQLFDTPCHINLDQYLKRLMKRSNFDSTFKYDGFFYILVIHRAKRIEPSKTYTVDCVNDMVKTVADNILLLPDPFMIKEAVDLLMKGAANVTTFFPAVIVSSFISLSEMLSDACLTLCESYHKGSVHPNYFSIAALCVTISLKLSKDSKSLKKRATTISMMWQKHFVEPAQRIQLDQEFFADLIQGLNLMQMFVLPKEYLISVKHLHSIAHMGLGRVRPIYEITIFLGVIETYCLEYWNEETILINFIKPQRKAYANAIHGNMFSRARITDLTIDGTVASVIDMGIRFLLSLVNSSKYKWGSDFYEECSQWLDMFIKLIDLSDTDALTIVKAISHNWQVERFSDLVKQSVNMHFLQSLPKLTNNITQFIRVFDSASEYYWQTKVLTEYVTLISLVKLPDNIELCNSLKQLIIHVATRLKNDPAEQSPIKLLLPLIKNVAQCYQNRNEALKLLLHLLQLHSPDSQELFTPEIQSPFSDSDSSVDGLTELVKTFVLNNKIFVDAEPDFKFLLDFTSVTKSSFQCCIVGVIVKVISDKEWLPKSTLASVALNLLVKTNKDYGLTKESARTQIGVGILHCVAACIKLNSEEFQWLKSHGNEVLELSKAYCEISQLECLQHVEGSCVTMPQQSKEVTEFFNFICRMKNILERWKSNLLKKKLSPSDLTSMFELEQTFVLLSSVLPNHCVLVEDIQKIKQDYNLLRLNLECLLVREVHKHPELSQCTLKDVLDRHKLKFSPNLEKQFIAFLGDDCCVKTAIDSYSDHVIQLEKMANEIKTFLETMTLSLDVLVFFQLHKSLLFEHYLTKCKELVVTTETHQNVRKEELNEAVLLTVAFFWRLYHGSATVSEVTFACSLQHINVEQEKNSLLLFSNVFSQQFHEHKQRFVGPAGISAVLELLQIKEHISVIVEACEQVNLEKILSDPDLQKLVNVTLELQSEDCQQNLTMTEAINMLTEVKETLQTQDYPVIFQLFKTIKDSGAFFDFAEEHKFTGDNGKNRFIIRHRIVTTQLQHEQYNEKLLDHLLGCFDYVGPFLVKPSSFKELMEGIVSLSNIPNGIKQLKTVNASITLVRHWFEGESFKSTTCTLQSILTTGNFCYRAVGIDSVDLEFNMVQYVEDKRYQSRSVPQRWSLQQVEEFALQVRFMQHEVAEQQKLANSCEEFLHIYEEILKLAATLRNLRALQIDAEDLHEKIRCSFQQISFIESYVRKAQNRLSEWQQQTSIFRQECKWLAFFSNMKLLQLHCFDSCDTAQQAERIVHEISIIFPNDSLTRTSQCKYVKKALGCKIQTTLPFIEYAAKILSKLLEYDDDQYTPKQLTLLNKSTCTPIHGSLNPIHFNLHYIPDFTHKQQLQFLCGLFEGVPFPFQLVCCTNRTTANELKLFFMRMMSFPQHKYVIMNANLLLGDVQEVLVSECKSLLDGVSAKQDSAIPMLHFAETGHSFLWQMPWITVVKPKDLEQLTTADAVKEWCKPIIDSELGCFKVFQLVFGDAGDGKTHYIKKELKKEWHKRTIVLSINECFDAVEIIKVLRKLPIEQRNLALFLNFTLPSPNDFEDEEDKAQFWKLSSQINWFFFFLFIVGYVEDYCSGLSYRLPGGLMWSVFVEIPAWHEEANESLKMFNEIFPAFHYLGEVKHIHSHVPFDVDENIELVCQYLQAKKKETLDHWQYRATKPCRIATIIGPLSPKKCEQLMDECLPSPAKKRKIVQRLYMKYMERRCKILEDCHSLQYNEGIGEVAKRISGTVQYTNTKHLRSLLFKMMETEVLNFCARKDTIETSHQQLIYDGNESFKFITLTPEKLPQKDREELQKVGIDIPSRTGIHDRQFLDSCLAHALDLRLNENQRISLIDENNYVMTLDYAVKMLSIHERRNCGIPVIINGETGVGKTFLLEMLSFLWNQSILTAICQQKSTFQEIVEQILKDHDNEEAKEVLDLLQNQKPVSLQLLQTILNLRCQQEPSKTIHEIILSELLSQQYNPILSLIDFSDVSENQSIKILLEKAKNRDEPSEVVGDAVSTLLCGILTGKPKKLFHKLCIHAALIPEKVQEFFERVIEDTEKIISWYTFCQDYHDVKITVPSITVFLDEVNTTSCPGFIKEIITDRTLNGKDIPHNIFIVAACNPHLGNSLATLEVPAGQVENWFTGSYRVRPFHKTLCLLMWKYQALGHAQENEYIQIKMAMIKSALTSTQMSSLAHLVSKSQQLIRTYATQHLVNNKFNMDVAQALSRSSVSQRDIQRVFIIYSWLLKMFDILGRHKEENINKCLRALFIALAVVYYFRLNAAGRRRFSVDIMKAVPHLWLSFAVEFKTALKEELNWMINAMKLPPGVAKTEALKENVYATVVCTMCQIPLIIVGQPGSSKTLSFKIVIANLLGKSSPYYSIFRECKVFKALVPYFYQCSPQSSSIEIESVFEKAINRQARLETLNENNLTVVMMDEAGLPESRHESLKVLHYYLDKRNVAFVGISNHILDAAKMNRAVSLFRPDTSEDDVKVLASGCLFGDNETSENAEVVEAFSRSYIDVMNDSNINISWFFGLRDFIYFCAHLRRKQLALESPENVNDSYKQETLLPQLIVESLERNFNGSDCFDYIRDYFLRRVFKIGSITEKVKQRGVLDILKESLADHPNDLSAENEVRYKLIIDSSEDESLVRLLFSFKVLDRKKTRIHVCNRFLCDAENEKLRVVAAIKHSASQGHTVLLSQTDSIHECFYDLFNQRFICTNELPHESYYANVTIGSYIKPCHVNPDFQCVVIIKKSVVTQTPAAFLNRFEKYSLSHELLLTHLLDSLPHSLKEIITVAKEKISTLLAFCGNFCLYGQKAGTLDSLLLTLLPYQLPKNNDQCHIPRLESKMTTLLAYLEWGLQHRLGFKFPSTVLCELDDDGSHMLQLFTKYDQSLSSTLDKVEESDIPNMVEDAFVVLKEEKRERTENNKLVLAVFQQWLMSHLCKRLMQLMTPEALVTYHEKIPNHYISHYLNCQSHFNLKDLLIRFHTIIKSELQPSVQGAPLISPSKLLCYCRSSHHLHNIPHSWSADESKRKFIQQYVFPEPNKLTVFKITILSTQKAITDLVRKFYNPLNDDEVLIIIANVEDVPLEAINHIRITIEENEPHKKLGFPKVIVLLIHFPPQQFLNHCYPSYFLQGWDHYYLDTAAPGTTSINIEKWFNDCCIDSNTKKSSFIELEFVDILIKEALPLVAPQITLRDSRDCKLSASETNHCLSEILFKRGVNRVIFDLFLTYWKPSVIIDVSEQASNLVCWNEFSLSITDAINTIIRSYLHDFLLYILSLMNDCHAITIVCNSQHGSEIEKMVLKILYEYPIPKKLSEVKIQGVQINSRKSKLSSASFPFFYFIYDYVEEMLNQSRRDVASKLRLSLDGDSSERTRARTNSESDLKQIHEEIVDLLACKLSTGKGEMSETNSATPLDAVFTAMKHEDIWERYVKDFTMSHSNSMPVEQYLIAHGDSNIVKRVADLHVCIRLYDIDKESLLLTRVLNSYQPPQEPCGNFITTLKKPEELFQFVIEAMYENLEEMSKNRSQAHGAAVKTLSSSYLQMMRLPSIQAIDVNAALKIKWDVIHTVLLILNCDEMLPESTIDSVLQYFLYFHTMSKQAEGPAQLGLLADRMLKILLECPKRSLQQVVCGMLEHFFAPNRIGKFHDEDICWFLSLFEKEAFNRIFSTQESGVRLLKFYLSRILSTPLLVSNLSDNPLGIFHDKARAIVSTAVLNCSNIQSGPFVPDFYLQHSMTDTQNHLLLDLYFSVTLEQVRQKSIKLLHIIEIFEDVSTKLDLPGSNILLKIEKQVLLHVLLEKLADYICRIEEDISELVVANQKINVILADSTPTGSTLRYFHGSILVVHILRRCGSVHIIHELLNTQFDACCRDYDCLVPFKKKIEAEVRSKIHQPVEFLIQEGKERTLYHEIKKTLQKIEKTNAQHNIDTLWHIASARYSGREGNLFDMMMLLCAYCDYYSCNQQEKSGRCEQLADVISQAANLDQFLDRRLLNLTICLIRNNLNGYEQFVASDSHVAADPLYDFFTKETNPDAVAMRNALVYLLAVVVGSPIKTNLWYHFFSPEELEGSFIPGFNVTAKCGIDQGQVLYDVGTDLSTKGLPKSHKHKSYTTRGTLSLQSHYFTLWANYGALCMGLFMDSSQYPKIERIFSEGLPLRHYCLNRAKQAWRFLSKDTITVEERVTLVYNCLENYYMGCKRTPSLLEGVYCQERANRCEDFLHQQCFTPAWNKIHRDHNKVYQEVCSYFSQELRTLDDHYPESANSEMFIHLILSSTSLHDSNGCLFVLYQFVLKRPLLNIGGHLLPDLISFYQWLHESLALIVPVDKAQQWSIGASLSIVLNNYSPDLRDKWQSQFERIKEHYGRYSEICEDELPPLSDKTKLMELLSVVEEELKGENILYNTIIRIFQEFNTFLKSVVEHKSVSKLMRYFANYETVVPLREVTVDTCCFGSSRSLDDISDLMHLISKCCGLTRSTPSSLLQSDDTLHQGCVPQVYDLEQLQQDIAIQFLAGKRLLQNPSAIHCDFRFKDHSPIKSVSDLFLQCSVINMNTLKNLPSEYKEKLPTSLKKDLYYEFHTVQYYTLLDVIIGLNSVLRHLMTKFHESGDHERNSYLHIILVDFLINHTGCDSSTDILETVGIFRVSQSASNVSLRDSQYDFLKNLEMRHVFKTLTVLAKWMRLGMYDFSTLPFVMKVKMHNEDKTSLRNIAQAANRGIIDEIRTVNEQLVQCERALVNIIKNKAEEVPIKQIIREELGITEEMTGIVVGCISNGVRVQHYVHLRLELRRLQEKIRGELAKEAEEDRQEKPWVDWVVSSKERETGPPFDAVSGDHSSSHGFRYEQSSERDLAKHTPESTADDLKKADAPLNLLQLTPTTNSKEISLNSLCCLPNNRSLEECKKLEELCRHHKNPKRFLERIGLPDFARTVEENGLESVDIIFFNDEELSGLNLTSAVDRLKFRVFFQRELFEKVPEVAEVFGVKEVVEFFKGSRIPLLKQYASIMEIKKIDGELLLLAENDALKELEFSAVGVRLIKKHFTATVLQRLCSV